MHESARRVLSDLVSKHSRGGTIAEAPSEGYTSALDVTGTGPDADER